MPPKLIIEVLGDTSNLERSFARSSRSARGFGRDVERAGRGALAASVSFRGLGRSVGFASAQFLGGAGLVFAIKSTIGAAEESQRVLGQTGNAVTRVGLSWGQYGKQVERAALQLSKVSGFDDERLLGTFAGLVRRTKDVNEALKLNVTAANLARGANIDLEQAAKIVQRAAAGQARGLAVLGVETKKGATGFELLTQINQKFANSAKTFGNTAAGAQDRFRVALENMQEVLGKQALPAIARYLNRGADWLNQTKNQKRVTDAVRGAIKTLHSVIEGITPIVKAAADVAERFSHMVGGAANAVKLLGGFMVALKFSRMITGLAGIGAAAGAAGAAGEVGLLASRLSALSLIAIPAIVIPIAIQISQSKIGKKLHLDTSGIDIAKAAAGGIRDVIRSVPGGKSVIGAGGGSSGPAPLDWFSVVDAITGGFLTPAGLAKLRPRFANQEQFGAAMTYARQVAAKHKGGLQGISGAGTAGQRPPAPPKVLGLDKLIPKGVSLQLAQARTEGQQRDALGRELAVINKKLRGRLAIDDRIALENEKSSILSGLKSMNDAEASARKSAADKTRADAKRAADKAKADAKREASAAVKALHDRLALFAAGIRSPHLGLKGGPLGIGQVNKAIAATEQAAQFRALGLTGTGDQRAPTARGLLRISDQLIGRAEPGKIENRVKSIRAVIANNFKGMSDDVRRTIKQMLDDIDGQLDGAGAKPTGFRHGSPNKLARLLGLGDDRDSIRRAGAILSGIGAGGTVPGRRTAAFAGAGGGVHFHGPVSFHGVTDVKEFEGKLARVASRRPQVRRGAR